MGGRHRTTSKESLCLWPCGGVWDTWAVVAQGGSSGSSGMCELLPHLIVGGVVRGRLRLPPRLLVLSLIRHTVPSSMSYMNTTGETGRERTALKVMALDENMLDERQEAYLEWLCTAPQLRQPTSKAKYAHEHHIHETTLRRWEKLQPFRDRWKDRVDQLQGSPERTQELLDSLYDKAVQGDVKAAQLWLQATNRLQPQPMKVEVSGSAKELSDAELDEMIAMAAAREKLARSASS